MWQSCPPSRFEILSSLRNRFLKLSEDYNELQRLNKELEDELIQESRNKEIIKSLKQQRSHLGRFGFPQLYRRVKQNKNELFLVHKIRFLNRILLGGFLAGEGALFYYSAPAFVAVNAVAAFGCFCGCLRLL